ncbi:substrate binding domain-containing protein, partial [Ideonella sp.]|uniref:substrate binding domain-containing protein n=1 Tax=Ideonella sp. TaxID=1929293 RepID=UPI003BB574DC
GVLEDSGLFARKVLEAGQDRLVASPAYLEARGAPHDLAGLDQHDCLVFSHAGERTTWRLCGPDGADAEVQVAGRFSANTTQALRKACLGGLGIALLPATLTRRELRAGLLVPVLPQYFRAGHGVHLVYPSRRHLAPAVALFIELLVDKMSTLAELPGSPSA